MYALLSAPRLHLSRLHTHTHTHSGTHTECHPLLDKIGFGRAGHDLAKAGRRRRPFAAGERSPPTSRAAAICAHDSGALIRPCSMCRLRCRFLRVCDHVSRTRHVPRGERRSPAALSPFLPALASPPPACLAVVVPRARLFSLGDIKSNLQLESIDFTPLSFFLGPPLALATPPKMCHVACDSAPPVSTPKGAM